MRDMLEQRLAADLQRVADNVPDGIDPPADLEQRVAVRKRRRGATPGRRAVRRRNRHRRARDRGGRRASARAETGST